MKKLILLILLLIPAQVWAFGHMMGGPVVEAGGGTTADNCPDLTYDFAWTGDNTSGASTACADSGASTISSLSNNGATVASTGITIDANDETQCWTISEDATVGTLWVTMNTTSLGDNAYLIGLDDGTDSARILIESGGGDCRGYYADQSTYDNATNSTGVDVRYAYTWNVTTGGNKILSGSTDWDDGDEDTDTLVDIGTFTRLCVGDIFSPPFTSPNVVVKDIYFINGTYEAEDPTL
jgi:hypothetical protein